MARLGHERGAGTSRRRLISGKSNLFTFTVRAPSRAASESGAEKRKEKMDNRTESLVYTAVHKYGHHSIIRKRELNREIILIVRGSIEECILSNNFLNF